MLGSISSTTKHQVQLTSVIPPFGSGGKRIRRSCSATQRVPVQPGLHETVYSRTVAVWLPNQVLSLPVTVSLSEASCCLPGKVVAKKKKKPNDSLAVLFPPSEKQSKVECIRPYLSVSKSPEGTMKDTDPLVENPARFLSIPQDLPSPCFQWVSQETITHVKDGDTELLETLVNEKDLS